MGGAVRLVRWLFHRLAHRLGFNLGRVETWHDTGRLMIGFRCSSCGYVESVHELRDWRQDEVRIPKLAKVTVEVWGVWNLNGKGGWCYSYPGNAHPFRGSIQDAQSLAVRLTDEGRGRHEARLFTAAECTCARLASLSSTFCEVHGCGVAGAGSTQEGA